MVMTILFLLGEGTYGRVFKARTKDGRIVVVKEFADKDASLEERDAYELLGENIPEYDFAPRLLAYDETHLVIDYYEGKTLDKAIKNPTWDVIPEVLDLLSQGLRIVQALSAKGLVHRDIKPQNLMVVREGGKPCLKLIDFGLLVKSGSKEDDFRRYTWWFRSYAASASMFQRNMSGTTEEDEVFAVISSFCLSTWFKSFYNIFCRGSDFHHSMFLNQAMDIDDLEAIRQHMETRRIPFPDDVVSPGGHLSRACDAILQREHNTNHLEKLVGVFRKVFRPSSAVEVLAMLEEKPHQVSYKDMLLRNL
jgi:serine/threonine protein kinase